MALAARSRMIAGALVSALLAVGAQGSQAQAVGNSDPPAVYLWSSTAGLEELEVADVARWGGLNAERGQLTPGMLAALQQGRLRSYLGHAPGRDTLHLDRDRLPLTEFEATRQSSLLRRPDDLFDPATWSTLSSTARGNLRGQPLPFDFVSLGDEISLVPWGDPLEFVGSDYARAAFAEWCSSQGLPDWSWDSACFMPALQGDTEDVAAFLSRRRFEREWLTDRLLGLAAQMRAHSERPLGLLGLFGPTAFGGLELDRLTAGLEVLEPYSEGLGRLRVASTAGPETRWLTTLFLDHGTDAPETTRALWDTWAQGCSGYVVWSARAAIRYPGRSERLLSALDQVRRLHAQGEWHWEGPQGVALVVDDDQLGLDWLRETRNNPREGHAKLAGWYEREGVAPRRYRAWIRSLESLGLSPGVLRPEGLTAESAKRFPLAILDGQQWIGASRARRLEAYLQGGGRLLLVGANGVFDEHGRQRPTSLDAQWKARHPDQVRTMRTRMGEALGELKLDPRSHLQLHQSVLDVMDRRSPPLPRGWTLRQGSLQEPMGEKLAALLVLASPGQNLESDLLSQTFPGWVQLADTPADIALLIQPSED